MTDKQIVSLLRKAKGSRTQTQVARDIGVSFQFLSDVLRGQRRPSGKILEYLELKRDIVMTK